MGLSIDREKVIKGLERCKLYNKVNCDKCPYDYNGRGEGKSECTAELASDAIALLKEQEPVKPTYEDFFGNRIARCGKCNGYIVRYKYCPGCGQAVKWE